MGWSMPAEFFPEEEIDDDGDGYVECTWDS